MRQQEREPRGWSVTDATPDRGPLVTEGKAEVAGIADAIEEQWPEIDLFRLCIVGYLRHFHATSDASRRHLIRRSPRLTGTVWDAAVGASIEHVCLTHGYRPPAWTDEPERFRHGPELLLDPLSENVVCHLPAPFARRGVALDARDLDARGGDTEPWRPDVGDADPMWPKPSGLPENERPRAGDNKSLYKACECIEQEALQSGWALRVALARGAEPARTFALRGINGVDKPIIALEENRVHELLVQGLKRAKLSEKEWQQRLRKAANAGRHKTVPPRTIWSRPALTVSGTAPGILAQWEQACRQATK